MECTSNMSHTYTHLLLASPVPNWLKSAQFPLSAPGPVAGGGSCVQFRPLPPEVSIALTPDRSSSVVNSDFHDITPTQCTCTCKTHIHVHTYNVHVYDSAPWLHSALYKCTCTRKSQYTIHMQRITSQSTCTVFGHTDNSTIQVHVHVEYHGPMYM